MLNILKATSPLILNKIKRGLEQGCILDIREQPSDTRHTYGNRLYDHEENRGVTLRFVLDR